MHYHGKFVHLSKLKKSKAVRSGAAFGLFDKHPLVRLLAQGAESCCFNPPPSSRRNRITSITAKTTLGDTWSTACLRILVAIYQFATILRTVGLESGYCGGDRSLNNVRPQGTKPVPDERVTNESSSLIG
jgi:hypothetical protein